MSVEDHPWIRDRDGVLSFLHAHVGQDVEIETARKRSTAHVLGQLRSCWKLRVDDEAWLGALHEIIAVRETPQTTSHTPSEPDGWVRGDAALAEFFARNYRAPAEIRLWGGDAFFTKVWSSPCEGKVRLPGAVDGEEDVRISHIERARLAPSAEASTPPEPAADSAFKGAALLVTARPPPGLKDDELIFWRAAVLAAVPLSEYGAEGEPWRNIPVDFADSVVLACRERIKPDTLAETDEAAEPSEDVDWFTGPGEAICEVCDVVSEGPFQRVYSASSDEWCRLCDGCAAGEDGPEASVPSAAESLKEKMRKRERENPENVICHSGPSYTTFDEAGEPVTVHRRPTSAPSTTIFKTELPASAGAELEARLRDHATIRELTTTLETLRASHERLLQERAEPAPQTATFTDSVDPLQTFAARLDSASEVPRRECQVVTQPGASDLEATARELVACSWYRHVDGMTYARLGTRIPGLASPATLGCIEHVLLREAWGKDVCIDVDEEKGRNLYCCTITVIDDCLLSELRRKGGTALEARAKALVAVLCAAPPKGGA